VIGDIASSIDEKKRDAGLDQLLAGNKNIIQAARPADGDGWRMFQKQQEIGDFALDSLMMKPSLQLPSFPTPSVYKEDILSFLEDLGYQKQDFVFFP